jgi:hypothetical protein
MSRCCAPAGLALLAALLGGRGHADPPPPQVPIPKLTAQEVAVREEKAGQDPALLLEVAALADAPTARRLRKLVGRLLQLPPADAKRLAGRVAAVLPRAAATPDELEEVLGRPRAIARQILYRRAVEQWHYDSPLPLVAVFDRPRLQDGRLRTVLPPDGIP